MISKPCLLYENSESNVFKNTKFLGEISNNLPNNWLWTNVYKWISLIVSVGQPFLWCIEAAASDVSSKKVSKNESIVQT